ncbi:MAG: M20/M25/M40 family metallo-hydrolase, partial [Gemmatimonadetes bacterium]|nr:M20/M25/M40 family metallo-hydrolase [Gemmatimonadota bacterium]NIR38537.1 M20/M25/M40 family metallo-hydrolase [Actinomycetota bacterium]NIS33144.1 M20/M25/M40 family metallo-hydrolase [Actinomycetota bacterium]NIT96670.1 M20/M25/M40 family metallo-hydrolase [Actinomycetota bacterium]NIU68061.1 M20/M25/M40 family metallo-hydrolase [Actinomycetota bacterium]
IATNIIPPVFDLNLNYRFNPGREVAEAVEELRRVCAAADVVEIVDTAPAGPVEVAHPFLETLERTSGASRAPKQGWTDVARLGVHGVPAVNYGPGRAAQAHQVDEWVSLDELAAAYESLRSALAG